MLTQAPNFVWTRKVFSKVVPGGRQTLKKNSQQSTRCPKYQIKTPIARAKYTTKRASNWNQWEDEDAERWRLAMTRQKRMYVRGREAKA